MKYDVTVAWTRVFVKTISVEAASEDEAESRVKTSLKTALAAGTEDHSTWNFDSEDLDIESIDEVEAEAEGPEDEAPIAREPQP